MYPTSNAYDTVVYEIERYIAAKVTFDISDVTAIPDIVSITVTTQSSISDKDQLANKMRDATYNLATWEMDRFRLDGSFSFPDSTLANNGEVGYISSEIGDEDGEYSVNPTITVLFGGDHSSAGLTITFDPMNGEYAEDFEIRTYDDSDALIDTVSVTDNDQVIYTHVGDLNNYRKVIVEIQKWGIGERRARVIELDFGVIKEYTNDSLIQLSMVEEMDLTTSRLPSPEFKFTVDNSDRLFNILNPTGFYFYLQQRQPIEAQLGLDIGAGIIEWIPLGNFLLWEWASDEGSLTASFTARTNLDIMGNFDYEQLSSNSQSLSDLAVDLFSTCGITNYVIDTSLQSITTNSMAKKTTCRNVLQMVALAGCANIFVTRNNVIHIKQLSFGSADDRIDFDNIYQEPKIVLDPVVKRVEVSYWTDLDTSAIESASSGAIAGDVLKLENNTLINTDTRAAAVATWIMAQKNYRADHRIEWRGNPAHELSDMIDVENSFGADKKGMIIRNDIRYQGYLAATTNAKGAVS